MVFFIVKPRAGQGMGLRLWEKMKEEGKSLLGEEGFSVFFTEKQGDARLFAREITREINKEIHSGVHKEIHKEISGEYHKEIHKEIAGENHKGIPKELHGEYSGERNREAKAVSIEDRICVIGGTGTLNEVIDGAMLDNNSFPISFLPVHRDNDFARALQKGYKIPESLSALFAKEERKVDYGIVEGERGHRRFVVSVGLGFEAAILQELLSMGCSICPKEKQRIRSKALSYFYAFVKELKRAKKIKGSILLDGEERVEFQHILFLSIHNHPYESGYALGCGASGEDGVLDLCLVSTKKKLRLLYIMFAALFGKHKSLPGVHCYRFKKMDIHLEQEVAFHVDGESLGKQKDLSISCMPGRLRLQI